MKNNNGILCLSGIIRVEYMFDSYETILLELSNGYKIDLIARLHEFGLNNNWGHIKLCYFLGQENYCYEGHLWSEYSSNGLIEYSGEIPYVIMKYRTLFSINNVDLFDHLVKNAGKFLSLSLLKRGN